MLLVHGRCREQLVGNVRVDLRRARADHVVHSRRLVLARRVALVQLARQLHVLRPDVGDGQPAHLVAVDDVHRAPVGQLGNHEPRELAQRALVVE